MLLQSVNLTNASVVANDNKKCMDTSEFLAALFGDQTEGNVELRSFDNGEGEARPKMLFTREPEEVEIFLKRWDKVGRGMFFGCCPRVLGSPVGKRNSISECTLMWLDIDVVKMGLDSAAVRTALETCPCPPSVIVFSGGGLHAYWILNEALDISDIGGSEEEEAIAVLKQLAGVFGGDTKVCELARVMRLPGSHNSKPMFMEGMPDNFIGNLCEVIGGTGVVWNFSELVDWLDYQIPLIEIAEEFLPKVARDVVETDPYLAVAQKYGYKAPLDIEKMLNEMNLGGGGDSSIHQTQLMVSASMVSSGCGDEEIVSLLLGATEAAAGIAGSRWNWKREEKNIQKMVADGRKKFGVESPPPPGSSSSQPSSQSSPEPPEADSSADTSSVESGGGSKAAGVGKSVEEKEAHSIEIVSRAVMGVWTEERGPLLLTDGNMWTYREGIWRMFGSGLKQCLRTYIQTGILRLGFSPTPNMSNGVLKFIEDNGEIFKEEVMFNTTGYIICQNGALDPRTGELHEVSPEHYATHKLDIDFVPGAECPLFLGYLDGAFSNHDATERRAIIDCLQEAFGAALVRGKHRELCKGIIVYGLSRTGKTVLSRIMRALVGGNICSIKTRELEKQFGMAPLVGASAWIRDDAVSSGEEIDAEGWKVVVTGEPCSVPRKFLDNWDPCRHAGR